MPSVPTRTTTDWIGWPAKIYGGIVALALLGFPLLRADALIAGLASNFDLLVAAGLIALLIAPLFHEITVGGVTLKRQIRRAVRAEVTKAQAEALRLRARMDLERMPLWEAENSSVPTAWSERKLDLLRARVAEFESQWRGTAAEDKVHYGLVLRDLYWEWLAAARNHYASSSPYQDVWRHVERGFAELAGVKHSPSR